MTESGVDQVALIEQNDSLSERTEAELVTDGDELAAAEDEPNEAPKKNRLPEIPIAEVAIITSAEDLQRVLESHRGWMAGVLDPKVEVASGRANLSGQDLRDYDLSDVNLSAANLSGANLTGVNLQGANLTATNLTGTMLACANLSGAKLRGARIDGADLRGADLTGANLGTLDLSRAIMKGAEIIEAPEVDEASAVDETLMTDVEGPEPHVEL